MRKYDVILEIQGRQVVVGYIEGESFRESVGRSAEVMAQDCF
ncbi:MULTISPECIES: hypothetical protein [unclassified Butyrivibrio]|nr:MULTISPECIES: hypothetical protein [unclassified Butyrivibrio]SEM10794.1 hypothetical protein SAMN04487770_1268 [Butyrivibrio sp. ob235]